MPTISLEQDFKNPVTLDLLIEGFHVMPHVHMTQRGKYVKPRAKKYLASQTELRKLFWLQMNQKDYEKVPEKTPYQLWISMNQRSGHRADITNLIKAIEDAMNEVVYPDDRWCDGIMSLRLNNKERPEVIHVKVIWDRDEYRPEDATNIQGLFGSS